MSRSQSNTAPDVITITTDQGGLSKQIQSQMNAAVAAASVAINQQLAAAAAAAAAAAGGSGGAGGAGGSGGSTSKKRKRHIAIDVETERAKLHALLNNTQSSPGNYFSVLNTTFQSIRALHVLQISCLIHLLFTILYHL